MSVNLAVREAESPLPAAPSGSQSRFAPIDNVKLLNQEAGAEGSDAFESYKAGPPLTHHQSTHATKKEDLFPAEPSKKKTGFRGLLGKGYELCQMLSESPRLTGITTLLTVYVLVGDDIRLSFTTMKSDGLFDVLTGLSLVAFAVELIACSIAKPEYFMSFFMVLDTIATVTLVLDFNFVQDAMTRGNEATGEEGMDTSLSRASRASRAGTKAARVVRIIRLIRLVRIVKLYKASLNRDKKDSLLDHIEEFEEGVGSGEQSRVGKKLSEKTTKKDPLSKQIGADIMMDNFVQWMDTNAKYELDPNNNAKKIDALNTRETFEDSMLLYFYYHNSYATDEDCEMSVCTKDFYNHIIWVGSSAEIAENLPVKQIPKETWNDRFFPRKDGETWRYATGNFPEDVLTDLSEPFNKNCTLPGIGNSIGISFDAYKQNDYPILCPNDLRFVERDFVFGSHSYQGQNFMMLIYFDMRTTSRIAAGLNVLTTLFICMILWFGSMTFSKVTDSLVLHPLERMIERVEKIKQNPMEAIWASESLTMIETTTETKKTPLMVLFYNKFIKKTMLGKFIDRRRQQGSVAAPPMETVVLEKTIIKIGGLMALGFGEAGMEIICQNMAGANSSNLNAMIPGSKVNAVFCYCDIRNFTDTTEILQDEVMVFVNKISGVIHPIVDEFLGAPNKNVGDSFLLVWRFENQYEAFMIAKICDLAMMALARTAAELSMNPFLRTYRNHAALCARVPNYSVRIGFGVHVGWAIEGAIGSEFKIDASYLSPHVNMASTLEAATKQYRAHILLSQRFVELLSPQMSDFCRLIDNISVRGYAGSIRLYTLDLDLNCLEAKRDVDKYISLDGKKPKPKNFIERHECKREKLEDSYNVYEHFSDDVDIAKMRDKYSSSAFSKKFHMGILNYESGEWANAKVFFEYTLNFLDGDPDGPSELLLKFMGKHNFDIGKEWPGYRELSDD